ncbi:MAG: sugar phosphate isomerase/epimerase [Chitinophagaceae bacterium]
MSYEITRRKFLAHLGVASLAFPLTGFANNGLNDLLDIRDIQLAYSAITWGGNDKQAIQDISSLGFRGIQLRANAYQTFGQKPEELKKLLQEAKLELAMFSSGNANINTGKDEEEISKHVVHANFVKTLGGKYIQLTNSSRPKTGSPSEEDLIKYGRMLTEVGKRTVPLGVDVAYHNHMHQLGETPEEVDIILKNTDPQYVKFELDVAHYQQGGGDPASAVRKYKDRLKALHIKDVRDRTGQQANSNYVFVELGQGRVDFPAIFKALDEIKYKGYAIVELDAVPDKAKTPLECASISKAYLKDKLKFSI